MNVLGMEEVQSATWHDPFLTPLGCSGHGQLWSLHLHVFKLVMKPALLQSTPVHRGVTLACCGLSGKSTESGPVFCPHGVGVDSFYHLILQ